MKGAVYCITRSGPVGAYPEPQEGVLVMYSLPNATQVTLLLPPVSTTALLHVSPVTGRQPPAEQVWPAGQMLPHTPQLFASESTFASQPSAGSPLQSV